MNEIYEVIPSLRRSRIYSELSWRRFERKARLPLMIGLAIWSGWVMQMMWALSVLQVRPIITL